MKAPPIKYMKSQKIYYYFLNLYLVGSVGSIKSLVSISEIISEARDFFK